VARQAKPESHQCYKLPPLTPEQQKQAEEMLKVGNWVLKRNPAFKRRLGSLASSIMAEAVVLAVQCWDERKGSKLVGWVARCVRLTLCRAVGSDGVVRRPGGDCSGHPPITVEPIRFEDSLPVREESQGLDFDRREMIGDALAAIHPRHAEVIRLHFWEHQNLKQIGEKFGYSRERARQVFVKAMQSLRKELARQGLAWAEEFAAAHPCEGF
jgi:RNA polymerase sigma factor (sigma-70 family)